MTAASASEIVSMPAQASVYFNGLVDAEGNALYSGKKVYWLNEEELLDELRANVGINGYITYAEMVLPDAVFGNQEVRGIAVQLSIINAEGVRFNTTGNVLGPNTGYYDDEGNPVILGVDPYDESTIDDTLGYYFSQIPKTEGETPNATIGLIVSTEQSGTTDVIEYSNKAWEFATYVKDGKNRIVWRYKNDVNNNGDRTDDGVSYDGKRYTEIEILVQSYGYSSESTGTKWQTWVTLDLAKVTHSLGGAQVEGTYNFVQDATITAVGSKVSIDGQNVTIDKTVGKEYAYTMKIDPTTISLEEGGLFNVVYKRNEGKVGDERYSELHGTFDLTLAEMQNFYNRSYVDTTIVFGDKYNNRQSITVRIYNATIRRFTEILDVKYYKGSVSEENLVDFGSDTEIASAYDDLNDVMPDLAVVTAIVEDSTLEKVTLKVSWSNIEAYDNRGLVVGGTERPKAYALIGNATFGFTQDVVTLNIAAETIKSVDVRGGVKEGNLPDALNVDPYDASADMDFIKSKYVKVWMVSEVASASGTTIKERYVSVTVDDGNVDYDAYRKSGYAEATHTIYFNVGSTVEYGANDAYSFDVRAAYPVKATLLSRKIVTVIFRDRTVDSYGNEVIGDVTELTGDVYKEAYVGDFDADDSPYAVYAQYGSANEAIRIRGITIDEKSKAAIEYTPGGGEFVVKAYVGEGELRQEFSIIVRINKAQLLDIVNTDVSGISAEGIYNGNEMLVYGYDADSGMYKLDNLVIEPFIGFVSQGGFVASDKVVYNGRTNYTGYGLPSELQVLLQKNSGTEVATLKAEWDYSAVLYVMTINGGEYDESLTNTIVQVKLYKDVDEDGNPKNAQIARVSVSVTPRRVMRYEVSYDAAGAVDSYAAIDDLIFTTYNGASKDSYELLINPYNLRNAMFEPTYRINPSSSTYSEKMTDASGNENSSFTYFRYAKAICEGGYEIVYKLSDDNYKIYDKNTGYATVTSGLYTGRNVNLTITVGEQLAGTGNELLGASDSYGLVVAPKTYGKSYVPVSDGENAFRNSIDVRILDMTYEAGNGLDKDMYFIDVYGIIDTFDKTLVYDKIQRSRTIIGKDNASYAWGESYTGTVENIASHTFETLTYDGIDANVNRYAIDTIKGNGAGGVSVTLKKATGNGAGKQIGYTGGVGRLIVTFGSAGEQAAGGVQTYDVPVVYVERTVEDILFITDGINGTTAPFYNASTKTFEFDPFVKLVNKPEGFSQSEETGYEQGYIRDGQYAATLRFKSTAIDKALNLTMKTANYDLGNQVTAQYVGVKFSDNSITVKASGGTFDIYAIVSNSGTDSALSRQRIPYKAKVLSRTAGVNDGVTHGTTESGEIIYYHNVPIGGKYYQIVYGFTANLFKDGIDGVLTTKSVKIAAGNTISVECLDEEKLQKALKVYAYIGQINAGRMISDTIFQTTAQKFYVYGQGTSNPIEYTYGNLALNQTGEMIVNGNAVKVTYALGVDEISGVVDEVTYNNGVQMIFDMDPTYGINYRGTGIRFYMTIPGYAAGVNEQQQLVVKVSTKQQYIPFSVPAMKYGFNGKEANASAYAINVPTNPSLGGVSVDFYGYAWLTYYASVISAKGGSPVFSYGDDKIYLRDTTWGSNVGSGAATGYDVMYMVSYNVVNGQFTIESPYYFIEDNGIQMPDYVAIYAGASELKQEFEAALDCFGGETVTGYDFSAYTTFSGWLTAWMANAEKGGSLDKYSSYDRKGTTKYLTALWSGGSANKIVVNYNDEERPATFKMTIDDQAVRLNFKVVPWLIGGSASDALLFRSTTEYGPEDIIMMPLSTITEYDGSKNADIIVKNFYDGVSYENYTVYDETTGMKPMFDRYYGYRLYFNIGSGANVKKYYVNVTDIYGGGTFRNNYNKWYFGEVQFGAGSEQFASITLAGKGGQKAKWAFENLSTRTEVNNNVPTLIAISSSTPYSLPKNLVVRYGSGPNDFTPDNVYIPISYSEPVSTITTSTTSTDGNRVYYEDSNGYFESNNGNRAPEGTPIMTTSVKLNGSASTGYRLETSTDACSTSKAQGLVYRMENEKEGDNTLNVYAVNDNQLAKVTWSVSGRCAYPATLDGIGGDIIVSTYGSKAPFYFDKSGYVSYADWKNYITVYRNKKEDITIESGSDLFRLYRPDNTISTDTDSYGYPNSGVGTVSDGYTYNKSTDGYWTLTEVGGVFKNWYNNGEREVGSKITLNVRKGTKFDIRNLPLMSVYYKWSAEGDRMNPFEGKFLLENIWDGIFGTNSSVSGTESAAILLPWQNAKLYDSTGTQEIAGGYSMIDTSSTSNKYVLKLEFSIGSNKFELTVHVNVLLR